MLEPDDIKNKLRVLLNESSSEGAQREAAGSLIADALINLGRIATAFEQARNDLHDINRG